MSDEERKLKDLLLASNNKPLEVPPEIAEDPSAREMLRCWSTKTGVIVSYDERYLIPQNVAETLGCVAQIAARILEDEKLMRRDEALAQIKTQFNELV